MRAIGFAISIALAACAHSAARAPANADSDWREQKSRFDGDEQSVIAALRGVDPSFAVRTSKGDEEGSQALAMSAMAIDAQIDDVPALAQSLARVRAARGEFRLEKELLDRLVAEETFRSAELARLPVSMASRVRLVARVASLGRSAPTSELRSAMSASDHDEWVAQNIDVLRGSLAPKSLTTLEARDIDDALDPLEKSMIGAPKSTAAIAALRVALDATAPLATRALDRDAFVHAVEAHLGLRDIASIRKRIAEEESRERLLARDLYAPGDRAMQSLIVHAVTAIPDATCAREPAHVSRVRELAPSDERAPICSMLDTLASHAKLAPRDPVRVADRVALHDRTSLALRAIAIAFDGEPPHDADARYPLLAALDPQDEARLSRFAVFSPVAAIAAGFAVVLIDTNDADPSDVVTAWQTFGDAPLDIALREHFGIVAATNH